MEIIVVNEKTNEILCHADVLFGLDFVIVKACDKFEPSSLEAYLMNRADLPLEYEVSPEIIKTIRMEQKAYAVSRNRDVCVLYALLNHFRKEEDDIAVYPVKDEWIDMSYHPDFTNKYLWRKQ